MLEQVADFLGVTNRTVESGEYAGKPARIVIASTEYETDIRDLWNAITDAQRISRWLCPVTGKLELGGRYSLRGNASGVIKECEEPSHLGLTWEYGDQATWLSVDLTHLRGGRTSLRLKHCVPVDEKWTTFGPGAVGVGWELAFRGLAEHLSAPSATAVAPGIDKVNSPRGYAFVEISSRAWCEADIASGTDRSAAERRASATLRFYTPDSE